MTLMGSAQTECPNVHDGTHDGIVGIGDLLGLLSLFGDSDGDGICDDEDTCDGALDLSACHNDQLHEREGNCGQYLRCGGHCL